MKSKEIKELINFIANSGLEEVKLETEEIKLSIKKQATVNMVAAPTQQVASQPVVNAQVESKSESTPSKPAENTEDDSKYITINSPMIGTFYRSANPESDAFVNVGDAVSTGKPVCIIEAMKLFNEIESEVSGKIVKVLVENATPVEYDQPLFLVDPS